MSNDTLVQFDPPLVMVLNRVVENHFPPGDVDYVEVIRAAMALATAYQRALETLSPAHANEIRENARAISEWMAAKR